MVWQGKFFGAVIGLFLTRQLWGAVVGALIGHLFDESAGSYLGGGARRGSQTLDGAAGEYPNVSEVFFRTTFELMGHVAKSDGRVSEREIGAARGLMHELRLGPNEIQAAIACFRAGKLASYDADAAVERLRAVCFARHDLLRAFIELQLRAALAGNDMSLPARTILTRAAAYLGLSGLEFAHMEAALRARQRAHADFGGSSGQRAAADRLAAAYAELEVDAAANDQEVVKAYRRQMNRHHPDKLVANGLPESMMQIATEKTQRIQEAYEAIRAARGMR
jgi:DnaJ like chaperone protein